MKILLVENDNEVINALTKSLALHRYILDVVKDGEMGWTYGSTYEYDLILLDIVLPTLDGISLCKQFRSEGFITPIILLTEQNTITAKVQGLDAGADDCVVKPFEQAELIARIRALLRRSSTNPLPLLTWGDLLLNLSTCEVSYNSNPLTLSTMEYDLLELLLRDSQHVFSTDELLDRLWSSEQFPSEATIRSHIRRLRQKLASVGAPKDFIANMHGRGYYLKAPATEESGMFSSTLTSGNACYFPKASLAGALSTTGAQFSDQSHSDYRMILISEDSDFNHSLLEAVDNLNLQILIPPSPLQYLLSPPPELLTELQNSKTDAIILRLPAEETGASPVHQTPPDLRSYQQLIPQLIKAHPNAPLIVVGEHSELSDRQQALGWGGQLFVGAQNPPAEIIDAIIQFLNRSKISKRVMILDKDQNWLYDLPRLLEAWDFETTTLADPLQFWTVLEAITPNVLILDAELPQINGFDLCQLVRSDPYWHPLPVLILSDLAEPASQHRACEVGADDYLCRPIAVAELAHRILNRLYRVRAWTA
jgi:DNA-binding response OmpR family regulator